MGLTSLNRPHARLPRSRVDEAMVGCSHDGGRCKFAARNRDGFGPRGWSTCLVAIHLIADSMAPGAVTKIGKIAAPE